MSRKDFELIAATLKLAFDNTGTADDRYNVCVEMAAVLGSTNPRFDRDRFLQACGVQ